ncbi:MAG: ornithine cyclodeaminase family protein [Actinomycetota bacterium]|nr:ornithine cyclodeaminase family protein [Actinomycetota bacterium]
MQVLVLSHADVIAALSPEACEQAMAEVLAARAAERAHMPLRTVMAPPDAQGFMGLMPAWRGDPQPAFALKAICIMPGNPARGLDAHQGTVTVFDAETGVPTAILDASAVTQIRTAAVSAVATRKLARSDARTLGILGSGVQGEAHLHALARVRSFERIRIYSPNREHVEELVERAGVLYGDGPLEVLGAASAEQAVRGADVVVLATSSREPVLRREWLAPGAHINAVGASTPAARELDVETVAAAALFCDSRESLRAEAGEFQLAIRERAISGEDHLRAELGEVLAGVRPGRRSAEELTLFRSLGLAVEDLAAAQVAVTVAQRDGLGVEVEL